MSDPTAERRESLIPSHDHRLRIDHAAWIAWRTREKKCVCQVCWQAFLATDPVPSEMFGAPRV